MAKIKLQNSSSHALCDDDDYDFLNQYEWYKNPQGYAVRYIEMDGADNIIERHMEEDVVERALADGRMQND